ARARARARKGRGPSARVERATSWSGSERSAPGAAIPSARRRGSARAIESREHLAEARFVELLLRELLERGPHLGLGAHVRGDPDARGATRRGAQREGRGDALLAVRGGVAHQREEPIRVE